MDEEQEGLDDRKVACLCNPVVLCVEVGQGKDIATILSEEGKEKRGPTTAQAPPTRSRKRRRLNDLESDSTAAESEEEFQLSARCVCA